MEANLGLPDTGGFFSTDFLIVVAIAIITIVLYCIFCILRGNKNDDLKGFVEDDFVDDDDEQ